MLAKREESIYGFALAIRHERRLESCPCPDFSKQGFFIMFDCLWRCLSPKSSNVGDWRFAIAKPPYELRTTNWANLPFDNPPKSGPWSWSHWLCIDWAKIYYTHVNSQAMPTILRIANFRFHFYSNEGNEPPHIHVRCSDGGECKFR